MADFGYIIMSAGAIGMIVFALFGISRLRSVARSGYFRQAAVVVEQAQVDVTGISEVPSVTKSARVVEVVVGNTKTDRTETVSDTVRRTDVDAEQISVDARTSSKYRTRL